MRAPSARVASFRRLAGSAAASRLPLTASQAPFSLLPLQPEGLRQPTVKLICMTDQSVIFGGRTDMVASSRKTGKRGAARARQGAARQDAGALRREKRRAAILAAALEEFAARGFAATRLDDVARRAKGTIYLYFRDKESLFQELVRAMLSPLAGTIAAAPLRDLPIHAVAEMIVDVFVNEIYGTRRKDVIRLIIAEGPRFPKLAEVYY